MAPITHPFEYTVSDGRGGSDTAAVMLFVSPVNDPPAADDQSVSTAKNTPVDITLTANDVDGDPLIYSIESGPAVGTLSGTAPNVTYTPQPGYRGADSFTFRAYDGSAYSKIATVTIVVAETPPGTMHVADITMELKGRNLVRAEATVTIVDGGNNPVDGATVTGHWSGATNDLDNEVTQHDGTARIRSDRVRRPRSGTAFIFTVDDVFLNGWTYDPGANVETTDSISVP